MRGLLEAVLLLASVLVRDAGAVSHQENVPSSAFITVKLPIAQLNDGNPYLNFRFDVLESSEACGFVNATVNGQLLSTDGSIELQLDRETTEAGSGTPGVITGHWSSDCLASDDKTREQRLQLRVLAFDGVALTRDGPDDSDLIIRFRQTAPVRIIDIEGAASAFRFNEVPALVGNDGPNAAAELDAAELAAWQQSLAAMHQHALLIQHDIRAREQYMRQRFGASSVKLACSDRSFLGALFHRITNLIGKSSWDDAAIRVQDSTGSHSWEQLYPPHEPLVCSSNNSRAGPPPPPPPPPPFLLRCAAPTTPSEEEAHNDPDPDPVHDHDHDDNSGSEEEFDPPAENAGSDEENQASRLGTWPGHQKNHTHNYRGMFAYIMTIAAISCLVMCSVHHFRDRMHEWHGHDRDVEEGGSDSGGVFRNRNRWRRANIRRQLTERWHSITRKHRERMERGRASRQTRQQVRREDRRDRMSVGAKILYFLKRILSGRGRDREKLLGRSSRGQNQQPGTARGHIEAVVVPPPSSPRGSFSEQREEQPDEQQRLLQEAERQQQLQQQRDDQQVQRQQQQQLQLQLQQQHQQILQQQQLQQQIQQQRRERQVREQQLQEQEQQLQLQLQQPLLHQQLRHPQPQPPLPQPQQPQQPQQQQNQPQQQKQQPEQYMKKQQGDSQTLGADHDRTPSPTMEQEIASFRAAADVVDQIIAAEEGRLSVAQTAKLKRQREQQQILASLSRPSPAAPRPSQPPPPPPSTVSPLPRPGIATTTSTSTSRTSYGYDRRDLGGIDYSDFDDTESLPPAYSETGFAEEPYAAPGSMTAPAGFAESAYSYVDLAEAEASMVADGFQYNPGGNNY